MFASLAFAAALASQPTFAAQDGPIATAPQSAAQPASQDGPIATAAPVEVESPEALRIREAVAYANPLPRGAPEADYPLVAWCEALVSGHVRVGESLNTTDELDQEIMRLGRLEAADFRDALRASASRQSAATRAAADAAAAESRGKWDQVLTRSQADRNQIFGLFYGLPGRCEHAARRLRDNITTPPATPAEVGLE